MFFMKKRGELPAASEALPGRETPIPTADRHFVFKTPLKGPYPDGMKMAMFGMGCFWGAERKFWQMEGVCNTAVGYSAGHTPNPTYEEVCSGQTAHNEVVRVVFDPDQTSYKALLKTFWESHNPTQFMAQGNDLGTQYRSGIYFFSDAQREEAEKSLELYQNALNAKNMGDICTEIVEAGPFYFAEDYHQQYLAKKPDGYCGLGGTGISCSL